MTSHGSKFKWSGARVSSDSECSAIIILRLGPGRPDSSESPGPGDVTTVTVVVTVTVTVLLVLVGSESRLTVRVTVTVTVPVIGHGTVTRTVSGQPGQPEPARLSPASNLDIMMTSSSNIA